MNIGRKVRKSQWDPGSEDYRELKKIRREISVKQLEVFKLEKAVARARSSLYSLNKALRAANFTSTDTTSLNTSPPDKVVKEDYIENVRLERFCFLFIFSLFVYLFNSFSCLQNR